MENIQINCHSSIKLSGEKMVYIDPFKINEQINDADFIFITHSHYDHFSPKDIEKIINKDTVIIAPYSMKNEVEKLYNNEKVYVEPENEYKLEGISFYTTYAYNKNAPFHPKENKWVGYIIDLDKKYYIAGDTDNIEELLTLNCDVALLPVGGTYTMNYEEAALLANTINASVVIPTHYGDIVGDKDDGMNFKKIVKNKSVEIKL